MSTISRERISVVGALSSLLTLFSSIDTIGSGASSPRNNASAELIPSAEPGWPQFRGRRRDGRSDEHPLLQSWPPGGPKKLWSSTTLGRGYSSPIIVDGRIYITGDVGDELHLFYLSETEGKLLWKAIHGASWKDPYPGARATPTYSARRIYLENAHGEIRAFDSETGKVSWSVNLLEKFRGDNITWGLYQAENIVKGAVLAADRRLYVLSENGWMRLLEAAGDKFTVHGEFRLARANNDAWAHPVIFGRRLYLRYQEELFCYDVAPD